MGNTVYGPYTPGASPWTGTTGINTTRLNNFETQASVALHGINADLSGPFVLSGITCTKDGTTANQLDIASGTAYVTLSDGTTGKIAVSADNTHTTTTPSTTYYLFLKNDGTWQWGTTSTGPTNSLPICQATTDGSGNISTVTDVRSAAGSPGVPYIVSKSLLNVVSATTDQLLATVVAAAPGMYQFNLYFTYRNATPAKVTAFARWKDKSLATTGVGYFTLAGPSGNAGQVLNGSQATTTGNNQACACYPIIAYAETGDNLNVHFQDPSGTPNDVVSVVIQRIG